MLNSAADGYPGLRAWQAKTWPHRMEWQSEPVLNGPGHRKYTVYCSLCGQSESVLDFGQEIHRPELTGSCPGRKQEAPRP